MQHIRIAVLVAICLVGGRVLTSAATLHVRTTGSDQENCSSSRPCRTIQRAVSLAVAGDTVIVYEGIYRERIQITASGGATAPITVRAEGGVETDGFRVDGSWIVVQGFRVDHGCVAGALSDRTCRYTGSASNTSVYGFWLAGDDVTIRDNYITGTLWGGAYSRGARNRILNNRFIRTGHPGITVTHHGGYNLVEGNEIADVLPYQYGPDGEWGQDQDGIRLFGRGHVIRNNYIHDNYSRRLGPHRDAMQTFDTNGPEWSLIDVLIEGNTIISTHNGGMFRSASYGLSRNVLWRNNIFMNGHGHLVQAGVDSFRFEGNIFYMAYLRGMTSSQTGHLEGNTFLWVRGSYPVAEGITGRNNWVYPKARAYTDPVQTEPGGTYDVRPLMANLPLAAFITVADGTSSTLYLAPADAAQLNVGSIIEINADGFARTVTAVNSETGQVNFTPAISGEMSRVPGSTLPTDYGQWLIAATDRFVALWPTTNVRPSFEGQHTGTPRAPTNLNIVR